MLVFVLVSEDNFGEGSATTSVVDNVSHDTLDIPSSKLDIVSISRVVSRFELQNKNLPSSFGVVECSKTSGGNSLACV